MSSVKHVSPEIFFLTMQFLHACLLTHRTVLFPHAVGGTEAGVAAAAVPEDLIEPPPPMMMSTAGKGWGTREGGVGEGRGMIE